ncbi:hypothetical protein COLO4_34769 [Corchorus olitorius]|uniref:Uncharacterized protein n=1 Tax=Corchorus olitorius TaxID=93759 RepID=A0A1R3GJI5_9ROSI|nr:hypothetical protein COLO4_34769 [Corchorus olitorius]
MGETSGIDSDEQGEDDKLLQMQLNYWHGRNLFMPISFPYSLEVYFTSLRWPMNDDLNDILL